MTARLEGRLAKLEQAKADTSRAGRLVPQDQLPPGTLGMVEVDGWGVILRVTCPVAGLEC